MGQERHRGQYRGQHRGQHRSPCPGPGPRAPQPRPPRAALPVLVGFGALLVLAVATALAAGVGAKGPTGAQAPQPRDSPGPASPSRQAPAEPPAPGALGRPLAGPTRSVVAGGARFAVPRAPGWSVSGPGTVVGYDRADGTVLTGPAFLRRGWCPGDPRWSSRALLGVAPPVAASPRGGARRITRRAAGRWHDALAGAAVGTAPLPVARPVGLADGATGWLARARTAVPADRARCAPPAVALDVLGVRAGAEVVTVVALRDVGVPGALPGRLVRRLLAGVRAAGAG